MVYLLCLTHGLLFMPIVSKSNNKTRHIHAEGLTSAEAENLSQPGPSKSLRPSREIIVSKLVGEGMSVTVFLVDLGYVFRNHRYLKKRSAAASRGHCSSWSLRKDRVWLLCPQSTVWKWETAAISVLNYWQRAGAFGFDICGRSTSVMCLIVSDEWQRFQQPVT